MLLFVLSLLLFLAAIALVGYGYVTKSWGAGAGGVGCGVLGIIILIVSLVQSVPARSVGVPTSFGKVESPVGPGIHFMAPWTNVNIISETVQTTTFEGHSVSAGTTFPCLDVRIGGQQTACLDVTIQWKVLENGASGLFNNYNGQDSSLMAAITDAVVIRELKQVVNQVLGDYNPIQDVSANTVAGNSQFSTFGPKVLAQMRADLAGRVTVINVLMPLLRYDPATQARLNQIQQQYGLTAIAQQQYQTNLAQAKANGAITASLAHDPGVLVYQCLQITQDAIKAGATLPAGWNCLGSSSALALGVKG